MSSTLAQMPPLGAPSPSATTRDPELDARLHALLSAVGEADPDEGLSYPPEWTTTADVAKRLGYLNERGFRLFLLKLGSAWLEQRASRDSKKDEYVLVKIRPRARVALRDMSHQSGVLMQDLLGILVETLHENSDALTKIARKHGLEHPWEAIPKLVK